MNFSHSRILVWLKWLRTWTGSWMLLCSLPHCLTSCNLFFRFFDLLNTFALSTLGVLPGNIKLYLQNKNGCSRHCSAVNLSFGSIYKHFYIKSLQSGLIPSGIVGFSILKFKLFQYYYFYFSFHQLKLF